MEFCGDYPRLSIEKIRSRAVFSDVYRFFDTTIAMKSDKEDMLERFRHLYSRFRTEEADEGTDGAFYIMAEMPESPFILAEEKHNLNIISVEHEDSAILYAYLLAANCITANVKSHFFIHGAAVSWNGDGLAIVGASYYGKTSLALQLLLRKGLKILSDDQLAIDRATHLVDPYPRGIGIRENTLAFFDELEVGHLEPYMDRGGQRKWLLDISEISKDGMGESCRLKYLVFLANSLDEMEGGEQHIELILDDVNDKLLEELRAVSKNSQFHHRCMGDLHTVIFQPKAEADSAVGIERLCENCDVQLLSMREYENVDSDFSLTPQIQSISWHTAVMELLKGLQNDFRSTPVPTFLELAEILEHVEFYRLSIGKLDEMGEHIWNLVSNSELELSQVS